MWAGTSSRFVVGASLLATVVNDNAGSLSPCSAVRFFASKFAPTDFVMISMCRKGRVPLYA
ncbi:hypothetical protein EQV97_02220 [Pseudomonas sp. TMW22090]|nr:hypothetical protein [Pseudomonas sp. TMW22090]